MIDPSLLGSFSVISGAPLARPFFLFQLIVISG